MLVGTRDGLFVDGEHTLAGRTVDHVIRNDGAIVAVADGAVLRSHDARAWDVVADIAPLVARCVLAVDDALLVGTSDAHLVRVVDGDARRVDAFDDVAGRDGWYTPWGGPPDTRSLARTRAGTILANVHVGGIVRGDAVDGPWAPTIDVDADVHEVVASGDGSAAAATAYGLAWSGDDGRTWRIEDQGLHARYARAVAFAEGYVLLSVSRGSRGGDAAIYRRPLSADGPLERCTDGLPGSLPGNVDTACLVADGARVAFGTVDGKVFTSDDAGRSWGSAAKDLPEVTALAW